MFGWRTFLRTEISFSRTLTLEVMEDFSMHLMATDLLIGKEVRYIYINFSS